MERRATVRTIASTIRGGDTCKRILKGYTFTLLAARTMLYSRKFNLQGGKLEHLKWKKKTFSIPLLTLTQVLMNLCTREKCYFAIVARYFHSMDGLKISFEFFFFFKVKSSLSVISSSSERV